jgi:hypothetical protein
LDVPPNSLPLYGLVNPASRLTWLWYLVAPGEAFHVRTTCAPGTFAPSAGLASTGAAGRVVVAVPFTKDRADDHTDQPEALPALARQYHRAPSPGKPVQLFDVALYSPPVYGLLNAASRLTWLWYFVAPDTAFQERVTWEPGTFAPSAGLASAGDTGNEVPFVDVIHMPETMPVAPSSGSGDTGIPFCKRRKWICVPG